MLPSFTRNIGYVRGVTKWSGVMLRNAQNVPQKSLLANRLDVVDANKS
ncbi:hypothetical protein AB07_2095 [Citrobacter freundii]|nr:hypothetical protein AB07_2095 [Citrobacter freundii]